MAILHQIVFACLLSSTFKLCTGKPTPTKLNPVATLYRNLYDLLSETNNASKLMVKFTKLTYYINKDILLGAKTLTESMMSLYIREMSDVFLVYVKNIIVASRSGMLQQVELTSAFFNSTSCNNGILLRDNVWGGLLIRATTLFNLQQFVALQVELGKCCSWLTGPQVNFKSSKLKPDIGQGTSLISVFHVKWPIYIFY